MFSRALLQVAREKWNLGEIETPEYARIVTAAHNPARVQSIIDTLEADNNMLGGFRDWDWEAILNWVRENLIPALRIMLPLILLLDEEK